MKRPVAPKKQQASRPKITARNSVRIRRPSSNQAKTIRPVAFNK